jgi:hypothetical protein
MSQPCHVYTRHGRAMFTHVTAVPCLHTSRPCHVYTRHSRAMFTHVTTVPCLHTSRPCHVYTRHVPCHVYTRHMHVSTRIPILYEPDEAMAAPPAVPCFITRHTPGTTNCVDLVDCAPQGTGPPARSNQCVHRHMVTVALEPMVGSWTDRSESSHGPAKRLVTVCESLRLVATPAPTSHSTCKAPTRPWGRGFLNMPECKVWHC